MSLRALIRISTTFVLACTAQADPVYEMRRATDGSYFYVPADPDTRTIEAGVHAYDNWRTSSDGGHSALRAIYPLGGSEIGDDIAMITTGPALMTDLGWSIWNRSSTRSLQSADFTLRLYDENRTLIFAFTNALGFAVPANSGAALFTNSNVFAGFNVIVGPHAFMSLQFSNAVGADVADIGSILSGPCTSGSSSHTAYNFTSGNTIDFDGSDQTNMKFFIDTATIPTPSAVVIGATAWPLLLRRRRRN